MQIRFVCFDTQGQNSRTVETKATLEAMKPNGSLSKSFVWGSLVFKAVLKFANPNETFLHLYKLINLSLSQLNFM